MKQSLEEKQSLAMEGLAAGKNCGQLVLLAYQEELNLPEELLLPLSAGLIEGLGTLEGSCGALVGANLVLAMKNKGNPMVQVEAAHLFQDFVERCGASICKDLRGIGKEKLIIPAFESHRIRYAEPPNPSGGAMRNQIPFRCSEPYPTMNLR